MGEAATPCILPPLPVLWCSFNMFNDFISTLARIRAYTFIYSSLDSDINQFAIRTISLATFSGKWLNELADDVSSVVMSERWKLRRWSRSSRTVRSIIEGEEKLRISLLPSSLVIRSNKTIEGIGLLCFNKSSLNSRFSVSPPLLNNDDWNVGWMIK